MSTSPTQNTLGDVKQFEKYKRYGPYHWGWYGRKKSYTKNADFLKVWVRETDTIEIGAGDGFITHHLGIKGLDNDPYAVEAAKCMGVSIDLGNAYQLPYNDEQFEAALMTDTVEHFSDPQRALAEARRVIRSFLYINIPEHEKFIEPDHYHRWSSDEFIAMVELLGFLLEQWPQPMNGRHYFKFKKI